MKHDTYLKVVEFARQRYTVAGRLVVSVNGEPSRYVKIESLAWSKYICGNAKGKLK